MQQILHITLPMNLLALIYYTLNTLTEHYMSKSRLNEPK